MTLFNELQERWKAIFLERESVEKRADELADDMQELEVALSALQSLHSQRADAEPDLFEDEKAEASEHLADDHPLPAAADDVVIEIEASNQSESCVSSLGAETGLQPSPGGVEESPDQFAGERWKYRVCWDADGDKFGDSNYETKDEAEAEFEKLALNTAIVAASLHELYPDGEGGVMWREIGRFGRPDNAEPLPALRLVEDGYAPVTNPEADQVVSAMSWYSPKEIAERSKFDPFGLFKREKEEA